MAVSEQLKALVAQMPDADGRGMYTENIDKEKIEKAVAMISDGGPDNIAGLIEMLGEPGSEENVKPHYALHCVANHSLVAKDPQGRKAICETIAAKLGGDLSDYNQAFLCQCLQWFGGQEAVDALGKLLLDEELVEPAVMALTAIRDGAADPLRRALPQAQGLCKLSIVQGLGAIEDANSAAALRAALKDEDRDVRITAGWGLSRMGDEGSVDALIQAADVDAGWERVQAAKHCLVLAEKLLDAGKKEAAVKLYTHLSRTRTDPSEQYIRDACAKALAEA